MSDNLVLTQTVANSSVITNTANTLVVQDTQYATVVLGGAQGIQGPQGAAGATGATGPQGPTGATGPQGPAGASSALTSVGLTAPSIFTVSNSPLTTTGTLDLTYSGTALPIANGGTGKTTAPAAQATMLGFEATSSTSIPTTAASGTGTTATLTFATQGSAPYAIGSYIAVNGVIPLGYNGLYQVTGCTTSSVSYANATTAAQTAVGNITQTKLLTNTSSFYQYVTSASTQSSFALPDTSTLQQGWSFRINNGSSGSSCYVYSSTGVLLTTLVPAATFYFTCIDTTVNTAAAWRVGITETPGVTGTSGNMVLSVSPTITGTLNFTGTSSNTASFGTALTTGLTNIGGTTGTGLINIGRATTSQPIQIGSGATTTATTASGTASSIATTVLTVGGTVTGTFSIGMALSGTNVLPGTYIISLGTGTGGAGTYNLNQTQTVASTTITGTTQKSIDIGTGGLSGSITNITLGSATTGATSTTAINGKLIARSGLSVGTTPTDVIDSSGNLLITVPITNGGTGASTASGARTNLGAATAGSNLFTLPNPNSVTYLRINADNTVSTLDAASFRNAIGAGTSSSTGTVTSIDVSGGTTGLTTTGGPVTSSSTITLAGTLAITNGGTGATTSNSAFNALAPTQTGNSGKYLTTDGTNTGWSTITSTGTVTSVGMTVPAFLSITGSPITSSGTLAVSLSGTALPIANGGTAATTSNGAFNRLSGYTVNNGVGVSLDNTSTYNQFFTGSGGGVTLPDVTTIPLGYTYHVVNQTSSTFDVESFDNDIIATIPINTGMLFTCIRITAPQGTAWMYATSDLWSTSDGSSVGNTGITGTGKAVLQTGATITNAANLSTNGPTLLQNGSGSLSIDDGGSTASTLRIIGQTPTLGRNRIYSAPQLRITTGSTNPIAFYTGASLTTPSSDGNEQFRVSNTASAVNYVQATGGASGVFPKIQSAGNSIELGLSGNGGNGISFWSNSFATKQFEVTHTATTVNFLRVTGSAAGTALVMSAQGTDTNISQVFQSKGTGAIDLAAGSSGVNISNGNTVTAVTRTTVGSGYTTAPTPAISAPTTAGGVQAIATSSMGLNTISIASGGSGYAVNDVIQIVGGAGVLAQLTVTAVASGAITTATILANGVYTTLPTSPASTTNISGTGTGASINLLTYFVSSVVVQTAGSGYVEQPTVTFSGGGGSGAAAYATVGNATTVKSTGSSTISGVTNASIVFQTPNTAAPNFLIRDSAASDSFLASSPASGYAQLVALGSTNAILKLGCNGAGRLEFNTNGTSETNQMRVAHTASAVNYVQVTGAATGVRPAISAQGSDATVSLQISAKGGTNILFSGNGTNVSFQTTHVTSCVNYLQAHPSIAGAAPLFSAQGSDTNIDLALTPKGTGSVVVNSAIRIDTHLVIDALTNTTSAITANQVLATFDATVYRTIKLTVQAADGTNYHSTELLAVHNGTTVNHTEYGTVTVGTACASYNVDYSGATVRLLATPASATATTYRIAAYLTRV